MSVPGAELWFCAGYFTSLRQDDHRARSTPQMMVEMLVQQITQFGELSAGQIGARYCRCIAKVTLD